MVKRPSAYPYSPYALRLSFSLSVWFVLWLTFADWQRMSTFLAHMCFPRFPSTYFHYNLLLFAAVDICLRNAAGNNSNSSRRHESDCFSDYAEAQLKLIELSFSRNEKGEKHLKFFG